jgi:8-oxo-dGTP diphosphatase
MQIKQVFFAYDTEEDARPGRFEYCPFCRARLSLEEKGGAKRPVCLDCGFVQYINPVPGVVIVIEKEGHILLGERAGGFGEGKWCLPQGYIEFDEDFLTAAKREVKEETGLEVEIQAILNVVSNRLRPDLHTLAIILLAKVGAGELRAGDDLKRLRWVSLSEEMPEMAFEADRRVIERYHKTKFRGGLSVDASFASRRVG